MGQAFIVGTHFCCCSNVHSAEPLNNVIINDNYCYYYWWTVPCRLFDTINIKQKINMLTRRKEKKTKTKIDQRMKLHFVWIAHLHSSISAGINFFFVVSRQWAHKRNNDTYYYSSNDIWNSLAHSLLPILLLLVGFACDSSIFSKFQWTE